MGYQKPTDVSKAYIINADLPTQNGNKYTIVTHEDVINHTTKKLKDSGFIIDKEVYRANKDANVAQGVYYLKSEYDYNETGMMFGWTNSYDKTVRFQCAIGAYVMVCSNLMVSGEISYGRKHIGEANTDIINQIDYQIDNAATIFRSINRDREHMMDTSLTFQEQCALAGLLYIEEEIINNQQLNVIKQEMKNPSFDYGCDNDTVWSFYNHVTHALKSAHPRTWMKDSKNLHNYITTKYLSNKKSYILETYEFDHNDIDFE